MKKYLAVLLAVLMIAAMAFVIGCANDTDKPTEDNDKPAQQGGSGEPDNGGEAKAKGEVKTIGNLSVFVPDGWNLQPGQNDNPDSCFVMKGSSMSDGYVWITKGDQALADSSISGNKSDEIEPFTVNGIEWSGKDACFCGTVGDAVYLIMLYGMSHDDANVTAILNSIKA